ncbi:MAG: ABC transporter permease subunit [Planctomycetota bacterium]
MTSARESALLCSGRWFRWPCALLLFLFVLLPGGWFPVGAVLHAEAWREIYQESGRLVRLASTTAGLVLVVLSLSLPLGVSVGACLSRLRSPLHFWAIRLLWIAAFTPLVLYVGGWQACFGPHGFWPMSWSMRGPWGAAVIHGVAAIPWVAAVVGSALRFVDPRLENQALLEWSSLRVLGRVTLRAAAPAIFFAGCIAVVPVLTDMSVTDLFAVRTLAEEIYTQFEAGQESPGATLVMLPLCLLMAILLAWLLGKWWSAEGEPQWGAQPLPADPSTRLLQIPVFLVLVVYSLPVMGLIRQLGLESRRGPNWDAWPVMHWSSRVAVEYLFREYREAAYVLTMTLFHSAVSAALAVAVAIPLAWEWRWGGPWTRRLGILLGAWLFVLPGPVLGMELIDLLNRPGPLGFVGRFYDSPWIVVYAHVVRALPYAFAVVAGSLALLDEAIFESALLEGVSPFRLLTRGAIPLLLPNLILAFLISLAVSLAELPTTKCLSPPGYDPLVLRIFHLLHNGTQNQQAALCLVFLSFLALGAWFFRTVGRRWLGNGGAGLGDGF